MSEQKKQSELDELLDSLLTACSAAQPRPGMETRLLARLRVESSSTERVRSRAWRWWWGAAGAATLSVVALAIYLSQVLALPQPPKIQAAGLPLLPFQLPLGGFGQKIRGSRERPHKPAPANVAGIRQKIFPTPAPLSDQERLLFRYLAGTPPEEVATLSHGDPLTEGTELPGFEPPRIGIEELRNR
jgi:hypothetical protein